MEQLAPNTELTCNLCGEKIGIVCMMSPDWSAQNQFISNARNHFENECPKIKMPKQVELDLERNCKIGVHDLRECNAERTQFYCKVCTKFFDDKGNEVQVTFY